MGQLINPLCAIMNFDFVDFLLLNIIYSIFFDFFENNDHLQVEYAIASCKSFIVCVIVCEPFCVFVFVKCMHSFFLINVVVFKRMCVCELCVLFMRVLSFSQDIFVNIFLQAGFSF